MLTLALDTTTRAGSVAVVRDTSVLAIVRGDGGRTHGERLPAEIERALGEAGVSAAQLQLLAVASGPGAFTGLRIGLAATQGLAMVLGIPVVAISALDALALSAAASLARIGGDGDGKAVAGIATWMDAQRGEVFAAWYSSFAQQVGESGLTLPMADSVPVVAAPDVVLAAIPHDARAVFVGDGAVRFRAQILQRNAAHQVVDAPPALAPFIARLGISRAAGGEAGPPHALQPLYVRRPDAELERLRREPR